MIMQSCPQLLKQWYCILHVCAAAHVQELMFSRSYSNRICVTEFLCIYDGLSTRLHVSPLILCLQSAVEYAKKELKVVFLELNWEDSTSYNIQEEDLVRCAQFIHQARSNGGSVLVHCAQVGGWGHSPSSSSSFSSLPLFL